MPRSWQEESNHGFDAKNIEAGQKQCKLFPPKNPMRPGWPSRAGIPKRKVLGASWVGEGCGHIRWPGGRCSWHRCGGNIQELGLLSPAPGSSRRRPLGVTVLGGSHGRRRIWLAFSGAHVSFLLGWPVFSEGQFAGSFGGCCWRPPTWRSQPGQPHRPAGPQRAQLWEDT